METLQPKQTPEVPGGAQSDESSITPLNPVWPVPYPPAPGGTPYEMPIVD